MPSQLKYRTENAFGAGVRDLIDIITYEFFALGNTDIPRYCLDNYIIHYDAKNLWKSLVEEMEENGFIVDYNDGDERVAVRQLIYEVENATQTILTYGLWLADYNSILNYYCDGNENAEIDAYDIENAIILSNLGEPDGQLYGFEYEPSPAQTKV